LGLANVPFKFHFPSFDGSGFSIIRVFELQCNLDSS